MTFEDHTDIVRRRYEYALGIDTRDWALYRSIFTDTIYTDFSSYNGAPGNTMAADDWVAGVQMVFAGLDATQHTMTNPIVDIDGDRATNTMYMQAAHFLNNDLGDREFTIGGYYVDKLVRQNGRWLLQEVTLKVLWSRGNRHIMELAVERGAGKGNA